LSQARGPSTVDRADTCTADGSIGDPIADRIDDLAIAEEAALRAARELAQLLAD
jgi:hypothetical protein